MIISYLDIDGLNLRDGAKYDFVPLGLFDGEKELILNDLYSDGESFNRSKVKSRTVLLQGRILGDVLTNINTLKAKLFKPGLKKLTCSIAGMPSFYIMVDLQNWGSREITPEFISCTMKAPKPALISTAVDRITLGGISGTSLIFPITFPISFGAITGAEGVVNNYGTTAAYPVITVIGTCNTLTITNQTTGESMALPISLGASDILIMDNRPETRGIYLNGVKRMDLKNGVWITAAPGENSFLFTRNSIEVVQHCTIELESRWY